MYEWKPDGSQKRRLRPSAVLLRNWFVELPGRLAQYMQAAHDKEKAAARAAAKLEKLAAA